MRRRIEIDRTAVTKTPVTEDITDMISKLAAWKPRTLEQVITVGERLIQAANEARFGGLTRTINSDKVKFFKSLEGKLVKYPNGIVNSTEYLYVKEVDIGEVALDMTARLTGIRLSKYNRIGADTIQEYTLTIPFSSIVDIGNDYFTVYRNDYRVEYSIVVGDEYKGAISRMKSLAVEVIGLPDEAGIKCKVSLTKKSFTKRASNDDTKVEAKTPNIQKGKRWTNRPTSTTINKAASKSCEEPSATTSSSPETTGNGTESSIQPKRVLAILVKKLSKKSPPSSKSL
jgi:hypothetical protein